MKKGTILTGQLVGFKYISSAKGTFCLGYVTSGDVTYKVMLGSQDAFPFGVMMQLKGAGATITATCSEPATKTSEARFTDVVWGL